ncbi:hypothetical protein [Streptomyces pinistramenti]|uniref:hypothetical protein n=1 Tax=Streptomyces pinistramenti TaxID=2884812 RepID=UPI001D06AB08|nr:hypothetical protein [Streptomyces pinistramenti]MCB5910146.1 hypothetical protein [Streptomyces pinistramenti]
MSGQKVEFLAVAPSRRRAVTAFGPQPGSQHHLGRAPDLALASVTGVRRDAEVVAQLVDDALLLLVVLVPQVSHRAQSGHAHVRRTVGQMIHCLLMQHLEGDRVGFVLVAWDRGRCGETG